MTGKILFLSASLLFLLSGCAMQRAQTAEAAQRQMTGMTSEQVFACMGIPQKKASKGETEIWLYKSGNNRREISKTKGSVSGDSYFESDVLNALGSSLTLEDEVRESRYCVVQIVLQGERVRAVHYTGPTGGFLTEGEQCAYAVRNCL